MVAIAPYLKSCNKCCSCTSSARSLRIQSVKIRVTPGSNQTPRVRGFRSSSADTIDKLGVLHAGQLSNKEFQYFELRRTKSCIRASYHKSYTYDINIFCVACQRSRGHDRIACPLTLLPLKANVAACALACAANRARMLPG